MVGSVLLNSPFDSSIGIEFDQNWMREGPREMVQWVRVLVALPEDMGSIPSTCMGAQKHLSL